MKTQTTGRLGISGTLEWRDKDGKILGTTTLSGSIPLSDLEQPGEGTETKETDDGDHDRK